MNDHNNIGLAAFFKQDFIMDSPDSYLLEDYIPDNYKQMPREIKSRRNIMIYLTFIQIIASIFGMFYIIFRRSFIYLILPIFPKLVSAAKK